MESVAHGEILTRYILDSNNIRTSDSSVKKGAFKPNEGEISVYRISGLTDETIWKIGHEIASNRNKTLKARADFKASIVFGNNTFVFPKEPPKHHAIIIACIENYIYNDKLAIDLDRDAKLQFEKK